MRRVSSESRPAVGGEVGGGDGERGGENARGSGAEGVEEEEEDVMEERE